jgi:hypothetical protein
VLLNDTLGDIQTQPTALACLQEIHVELHAIGEKLPQLIFREASSSVGHCHLQLATLCITHVVISRQREVVKKPALVLVGSGRSHPRRPDGHFTWKTKKQSENQETGCSHFPHARTHIFFIVFNLF